MLERVDNGAEEKDNGRQSPRIIYRQRAERHGCSPCITLMMLPVFLRSLLGHLLFRRHVLTRFHPFAFELVVSSLPFGAKETRTRARKTLWAFNFNRCLCEREREHLRAILSSPIIHFFPLPPPLRAPASFPRRELSRDRINRRLRIAGDAVGGSATSSATRLR